MLQKIINCITTSILVTSVLISNASANPVIPIPTVPQPIITPSAPAINAKSYVLLDADSGKVLVEKNADLRLAPASLTKLMTMFIVSGALKNGSIKLDDKVRISDKAWRTGGSKMFVKINEEVPVRDLIQGIVVASGNDATVAMAEDVAGSEDAFVSIMNQMAKTLGMNNSHFADASGLPSTKHYSTARDLAILARAIVNFYPDDYKLYSEKWFSFRSIKQPNRNRLLWRYPLADGLKTGHTDEAGYCLVASAKKDGTRYISVIMGSPTDSLRTEDSIRLLTFGFRFYETHKIYNANVKLVQARIWKGANKEVPVGFKDDFFVNIPTGQLKNLQASIELNAHLKAPVKKGQVLGDMNITLNNQVIAKKPVVALADDPEGGFFRRVSDTFGYAYHVLFSRSSEKANTA